MSELEITKQIKINISLLKYVLLKSILPDQNFIKLIANYNEQYKSHCDFCS